MPLNDIPEVFDIRVSTHENRLTREQLTSMDITETSVAERMAGTFHGVVDVDASTGRLTGFAMGDRSTGEMWVIAVRPEYLGRGIGSALLTAIEAWLIDQGCTRLWLTTDADPAIRAYTFYRQHGWRDDRIADGCRYMVKVIGDAPANSTEHAASRRPQ